MPPRAQAPKPAPLTLQPTYLTAELVQLAVDTAASRGVSLVLVAPPSPPCRRLLDDAALRTEYGLSIAYLRTTACPFVVLSRNRYAVRREDLEHFLAARRVDPVACVATSEEATA